MKGREFLKITRKFLNVVIAMVCTVSVFYGVQTVSAVEVIQETEYSVSMDSITDAEILAEEPTQQPTEAPTEAPTEPITSMSTSPIYTAPLATEEPARYYTVIDGDITYHVDTAYGGGDSAEVYMCFCQIQAVTAKIFADCSHTFRNSDRCDRRTPENTSTKCGHLIRNVNICKPMYIADTVIALHKSTICNRCQTVRQCSRCQIDCVHESILSKMRNAGGNKKVFDRFIISEWRMIV